MECIKKEVYFNLKSLWENEDIEEIIKLIKNKTIDVNDICKFKMYYQYVFT